VLAVMDDAILEYKALITANDCSDDCELHAHTRATYEADMKQLELARAAVAELIQALSECVIDMEATEEFYGKHPRAQDVIAKAKAALANVGAQP
ncbi:hypothetical protein QQX02_13025, partial [Demequina sp. EGI L300058]